MENLPTIIISAIVGAVVSYAGAILNNVLGARAKIDESLRSDRIREYKVLWKKTGLLPKWPRSVNVTYEKLTDLTNELQDWYFDKGGMFLSVQARKAYGDLQEEINRVVTVKSTGQVSKEHYEQVMTRCSALRTELTNDLLSRRRAFLAAQDFGSN